MKHFFIKEEFFITNCFTTERKEMKNNNASGIKHTHRIYKQDVFSNFENTANTSAQIHNKI